MQWISHASDRILALLVPRAVAAAVEQGALRDYCYRKESCPTYHTMYCRYSSGGHETCNCQWCIPTG